MSVPLRFVVELQREAEEATSWSDTNHRFRAGRPHVILLHPDSGRERHLFGEQAEQFITLAGIDELVSALGATKKEVSF